MADIYRKGYGQVEPNHLSAQTNGQVYAQLPITSAIHQVENGMFLKYDYASGECNLTGKGEWMLVMNEIKLYDERRQGLKDYVMKEEDFMAGEKHPNGQMVPRLLRTEIGDIYTTNAFGTTAAGPDAVSSTVTLTTANFLAPSTTNGFLTTVASATVDGMVWQVAKADFTMPDGQPGVKLQRIK